MRWGRWTKEWTRVLVVEAVFTALEGIVEASESGMDCGSWKSYSRASSKGCCSSASSWSGKQVSTADDDRICILGGPPLPAAALCVPSRYLSWEFVWTISRPGKNRFVKSKSSKTSLGTHYAEHRLRLPCSELTTYKDATREITSLAFLHSKTGYHNFQERIAR